MKKRAKTEIKKMRERGNLLIFTSVFLDNKEI